MLEVEKEVNRVVIPSLSLIKTKIQEGDLEEAQALLLRLLENSLPAAEQECAWRWLALVYLYAARYDLSQRVCALMIKEFPNSPTAWNSLGYVYWQCQRLGEALEYYRYAATLGPHPFSTNALLAWAVSRGRFREAGQMWRLAGQARVPRNPFFVVSFLFSLLLSNIAVAFALMLGPAMALSYYNSSPWVPSLYSVGFLLLLFGSRSLSVLREGQIVRRLGEPWLPPRRRRQSHYLVDLANFPTKPL